MSSVPLIFERPDYLTYHSRCLQLRNLLLNHDPSAASAFEEPSVARFRALSPEKQTALMIRLQAIIDIFDEVRSEASDLQDSIGIIARHSSHIYLRSALKKFGWKIDPSTFESLADGDTFEIYGTDFQLKVANMRFLQVCTYSLEDVLSHEFFELFSRDPAITQHIIACGQRIFKNEEKTIRDLGPDHIVAERFSAQQRKFWVRSKFLTPVYTKWNTIAGALYSASVEVVDES